MCYATGVETTCSVQKLSRDSTSKIAMGLVQPFWDRQSFAGHGSIGRNSVKGVEYQYGKKIVLMNGPKRIYSQD